jgi:hypothetical protein
MAVRHSSADFSRFLPMVLLFSILFVVNGFLVSPYIAWYDSGELIGTTVCLGISHPSGQALFHLLGKCFLLWPWGTAAFKVGLMSVFCAAAASALFYNLACRLTARLMPPDLMRNDLSFELKTWLFLLTLGWSWSQPWWRYSLTPLVYALHLLMAMLILWALSLEKPWKWNLAFFLMGAATILRPTQLFGLPFMGVAFLWHFRHEPVRLAKRLILITAFFALGRSVGLYLPLRSALHPSMAYGDITRFPAFFHQIFALRFSKYVGTITIGNILSVLQQMVAHFFNDLTPLGAGLVLWGICFLWWEREKIPVFLWVGLCWGLVEALFVFTIPYPTFESHQVLLGWAFCGFLAALPMTLGDQILRKGHYRHLIWAANLVMVVFVLAQLSVMGHLLDRKNDRTAQDYGRNVLTLMESNALYLPYEENEYFPVAGYQESFNYRKDIELVEPGGSQSVMGAKVEECLRQNRPIYVTHQWALPAGWAFESRGPLWKVVLAIPLKGYPVPMITKPQAVWGKIQLLSVQIEPVQVKAGDFVTVTYHWTRREKSVEDQTSSVVALFTDDKGSYPTREGLFWLHDIHEPFGSTFANLKPGLEYVEKRVVMIPSDYPPGKYQLMLALQKQTPKEEGQETFNKEFYERSAAESLDKFEGRGQNGSLVQFSTATQSDANNLWPVSQSLLPVTDARFAPAAALEIQSPD